MGPLYKITSGSWQGLTSAEIGNGNLVKSVQVVPTNGPGDAGFYDEEQTYTMFYGSFSAWVIGTNPLQDSQVAMNVSLGSTGQYCFVANLSGQNAGVAYGQNAPIPMTGQFRSVGYVGTGGMEAFTGNDTLTVGETGKLCTNKGATGTVVLTLPAASTAGKVFTFYTLNSYALHIIPNGGTITISSGVGGAGKYCGLTAAYSRVTLTSDGSTNWNYSNQRGTVVMES
jgi:hypothetical protein